jgi:hypothetical protein
LSFFRSVNFSPQKTRQSALAYGKTLFLSQKFRHIWKRDLCRQRKEA